MRFVVLFLIMLLLPLFVFAQSIVPCSGPDCDLCKFVVLINGVVRFLLFALILPASVIGLIFAGIILLTATGDPGKLEKGKSIFRYIIFGLIIAFGAWLIIDTILRELVAGSEAGFWRNFPKCD